jgi:hypothetical protein
VSLNLRYSVRVVPAAVDEEGGEEVLEGDTTEVQDL